MDKTRILPPQIRGRVTGVLDLFVDEIRLFRNILLLAHNFDLVLQVQWWGEILPVFIRSKEVKVKGRSNKNSSSLECHYHSAKYEIRTTLDLFTLYLKNCEVLELSVLEAFENYVIGSAFLKDLIILLNNKSELIRTPILDYLGEEIGEVIIHVDILWKHKEENIGNLCTNTQLSKDNFIGDTSDKKDCTISNKINRDCLTLAEKTITYDGNSKNKFEMEKVIEYKYPSTNKKIRNYNVSLTVNKTNSKSFQPESSTSNKNVPGIKGLTCKCLPQIETVSDSSKVLCFGLNPQQSKHKTEIKKPTSRIPNKFNSNSIKCKTKLPAQSSQAKDLKTKKPVTKNLVRNSPFRVPLLDTKVPSVSEASTKTENLKDTPSKGTPDVKVLDYLLGSDMSKEDEESALTNLKKMSPSHNLVDSINRLCITSDYNSEISTEPPFRYNFNNPIERNYYQRFFLKTNSPGDFEIAEFLNKPENSSMLDKLKSSRVTPQEKDSKTNSRTDFNKPEAEERVDKDLIQSEGVGNRKSSCARCKYYKKLNELDAIIESLKHFEQRMRVHEKDLRLSVNENVTIKRNHFVKDGR